MAGYTPKGLIPEHLSEPLTMYYLITGEHMNKHYGKNDPYRFALDNDLNGIEMQIIKYIARYRKGVPTADKFGLRDLKAAKFALERLEEEWIRVNPEEPRELGIMTYQEACKIHGITPEISSPLKYPRLFDPGTYKDMFTKTYPGKIIKVKKL